MNPPPEGDVDRWRTLMEHFEAAADLPPDERRAYLESISHDSGVRQEVSRLLGKLEEPSVSEAPASMAANQRFGRYIVQHQLGRGGMGEVYAAQDTELDRTVALKVLSAERLGGPFGVERLIREARILSALNHPNIVTIHEIIPAGSAFAIVMERARASSIPAKPRPPVGRLPARSRRPTREGSFTGTSSPKMCSFARMAMSKCWISASPGASSLRRTPPPSVSRRARFDTCRPSSLAART
jgi:hypothetical protein